MGYNSGRTSMVSFAIRASLSKEGLYSQFTEGKVDACRIYSIAMWEGVNDYDDDEMTFSSLDNVVAVIPGGFVLTYSKEEDVFDVWEQIWV